MKEKLTTVGLSGFCHASVGSLGKNSLQSVSEKYLASFNDIQYIPNATVPMIRCYLLISYSDCLIMQAGEANLAL